MRHLVPAASLLVALHLEQVLSFHTIPSIRTRAANLRAQHLNQNDTPFIEALLVQSQDSNQRASRKVKTSFFFPGHQLGRGTPSVLDHNVMCGKSVMLLSTILMTEILKYDLPEDIEDIDCLRSEVDFLPVQRQHAFQTVKTNDVGKDLEEALAANEGNVAAVLMVHAALGAGEVFLIVISCRRHTMDRSWMLEQFSKDFVKRNAGSHLSWMKPTDRISVSSPTQVIFLLATAYPQVLIWLFRAFTRLLASLDATRWQFGSEGGGGRLKHFKLLEQEHRIQTCIALDPLRLTLLTPHGLSAEDAAELLESRHGVYVEISEGRLLTAALGIASTAQDCAKLVRGLRVLDQQASSSHREREERAGMVAEEEEISVDNSAGRTSAETLVTYPPGIPILFPGEIITQPAVAALKRARIDKVRVCKIGL
ncbi:hypothetical protein GUITHDRAFT_132913 [Guillardia theta CCMP2712]|uniref:Orn/Lys/Arg decarboxylase C-terminal domain-containing protein n=1 Tax=Guillardia theta (strain CCMP2712) TaxID=905079 RepID=L1K015_GUITC|nr:hypothetical protein GUITHDRAFT_132913 [Guillardia theta CCMP2712]EKX53884.1 hypothetical protein GUITHDRAFT_132913 [Guillardia theta CCMP2712]|eukprot:XP_005840864.1 hypothetical protein GUITHDRAFT_132913 [Guillardia theta CCMP2712]